MKLYSFDEVQDMVIGKLGTPRRDKFERKMKAFMERQKFDRAKLCKSSDSKQK